MSKRIKTVKVSAECHSDDRACEVIFDATPFFKRAKGKDLQALARCGYGGDYPADIVAIAAARWDESVADMFKYIETRNKVSRSKDHIGFECHVNEFQARVWLQINRPRIYARMKEAA